jgi:hypothetical protein
MSGVATGDEPGDVNRDGSSSPKGWLRRATLWAGAFTLLFLLIGGDYVGRYKPLVIQDGNYPFGEVRMMGPVTTFSLKYDVAIENEGRFAATITRVDPVTPDDQGDLPLKTQVFLARTDGYDEAHPFHQLTLKKNQQFDVTLRVTAPCRPLGAGYETSTKNQDVTFDFLGIRHTKSIELQPSFSPAVILGPQSCKS